VNYFNGATNKKIHVTEHVLIEVFDHVKQAELAFLKDQPFQLRTEKVFRQRTEDEFRRFVRFLKKDNIVLYTPPKDLAEYFRNVSSIYTRTYGQLRAVRDCPICGLDLRVPFLRDDGPGRDDIHHAKMARLLECEEFVTLDRGFRYLEKDPDFIGMKFTIL
jgi:hypothetical protein